jgi:DNA (cytosine-5)-methyltransferase 1
MEYRQLHPDLIEPTRALLKKIDKPYVIENVESARGLLMNPVLLCGSAIGLPIERHRYFEIFPSTFIMTSPCFHRRGEKISATINGRTRDVQLPVLCTGGGDGKRASRKNHRPRGKVEEIRWAMGIDWMTQGELTEAIPPAYTEFIGRQLLQAVQR